MVVLGLTGSIGMGKTTAAKAFRRLGAPVYDADAAVHRLLGPGGGAVDAVLRAFPGTARDGDPAHGIDRAALGRKVFGDGPALKRLEGILHPLVRRGERRFLLGCQLRRAHLVVLDIPLLFETGGDARCDATAVTTAPAFVQRTRVLGRSGMDEKKFAAILERQMPDWQKRRRADFLIQTGLDRRQSLSGVRAIAARLATVDGSRWPHCWASALTSNRSHADA